MPSYFFDTSVLTKLYHAEAGTDFVERLAGQRNRWLLFPDCPWSRLNPFLRSRCGWEIAAYSIYRDSVGSSTSATITNLPTNGGTIYVRLWSLNNGTWQSNDHQYRAMSR